MKIKLDFITNSSSTAYVVMIPPNFKEIVSIDVLEEWEDYFSGLPNEAIKEVNKNIKKLKNGEQIYYGNCKGFYTIVYYLKSQGVLLRQIDMDGNSGSDIIESIKPEEFFKILDRYNKNENKT